MRNRLSPIQYIRNNKRKVAVLAISIGLFMTMQYMVAVLFGVSYSTFEVMHLEQPQYMQSVTFWPDSQEVFMTEDEFEARMADCAAQIEEVLRTHDNIDHLIPGQMRNSVIYSTIGRSYHNTPQVDAEGVRLILEYFDVEWIKGVMPSNPEEIVIDRRTALNQDLSLGDSRLSENGQIVGMVEADVYLSVGVMPEDQIIRSFVILSEGKDVDYNAFLESFEFDFEYVVIDYFSEKNIYEKNVVESYSFSSDLITVVSTVVLSISLVFVMNMFIADRREEWCIYHSIGFSQKAIYLCANLEILFILGISTTIAIVTSLFGIYLIKEKVVDLMGLFYTPFLPEVFVSVGAVILLLIGFWQISILYTMHRIRTVDAIEEDIY